MSRPVKRAPKQPARRKASYHHGDLRRALIVAAERLLEKRSAKALTLRGVAAALGVTGPASYRHFASKEALVAAVLTKGFDELAERTEAARAAARSPLEELGAVASAYVRFAVERPGIYKLMFGPECDKASYPELRAAGARAFGVLIQAAERCEQHGKLAAAPRQVALIGWAFVHGLSSLHADGVLALTLPEFSDPERAVLAAVPLLLGGVGKEQAPLSRRSVGRAPPRPRSRKAR